MVKKFLNFINNIITKFKIDLIIDIFKNIKNFFFKLFETNIIVNKIKNNFFFFFVSLLALLLFILFIFLYFYNYINFFIFIIIFVFFSILLTFFHMYKLSYIGVNKIFILAYSVFSLVVSYVGYDIYICNKYIIINLGQFLNISSYFQIFLIFIVDYVSIFFIILISYITLFVLLFVKNYFKLEPEINKFNILVVSFSISMIFLVISANFLVFFFFWEMIGLTSFFLINFYSLKNSVTKASFKAFYFNKISDSFILIGILLLAREGVDLIHVIPGNIQLNDFNNLGVCFLYLGASVKSSQLGFHMWLPDSMEAPVPASALIHSATLVSAGVYILIRLHFYLIYLKYFYSFLYIWFSVTALYGGFISMYQIDIKKLLAYSTISHCGFLFVTALNGNINHTMVYLFLHGIYKASSFIIAGRFIHHLETQDLRLMTQMYTKLPLETIIFIILIFSLSALPGTLGVYYKSLFLSSFFIKDLTLLSTTINFFGCLTGVGYSLHVIQIFFSPEIKLPKYIVNNSTTGDDNDNNNNNFSSSTIFSLLIFFFVMVISFIFVIYCNSFIWLEVNMLNKIYIFKLFYTFALSYIIIVFFLNRGSYKNYFFLYHLMWIILTFLIYWRLNHYYT